MLVHGETGGTAGRNGIRALSSVFRETVVVADRWQQSWLSFPSLTVICIA